MKEKGKNISDRKTRYKQLQDDLTEKTGYSQIKGEELDRTLWKTHFGEWYGLVRKTTE